jgi:hypothetical protein
MRHVKAAPILAAVLAMATGAATAQYHQQDKSGQTKVRQDPSPRMTTPEPAAAAPPSAPAAYSVNQVATATPGPASIPSNNPAPDATNYSAVWAYAIHHGDGSYTKSKQDYETHHLQQETFSSNGTLLLRRMISLDQQGRPAEVMIYNGHGELRYRGVLIYDRAGRIQEELIFATDGMLLRRRVQEFDAEGNPSMKVLDLTENIPEDLQLVVSERKQVDPEVAKKAVKDFQEQATPVRKDGKGGEGVGGENSAGKKKGFFRRLLGN